MIGTQYYYINVNYYIMLVCNNIQTFKDFI